jgi:hypothetical protein
LPPQLADEPPAPGWTRTLLQRNMHSEVMPRISSQDFSFLQTFLLTS